jgi:4a-hydroxytetrahydrobiopterin dehydratase
MAKLTAAQIKALSPLVPRWRRRGRRLVRAFEFRDFATAMRFVNAAGRLAEKAWHHPEIDIRWNRVTLALTTHDDGGLTEKDFVLAQKFDRLVK